MAIFLSLDKIENSRKWLVTLHAVLQDNLIRSMIFSYILKRVFSWWRLSFDVCFEDIIQSKKEEQDAFGARMPLLHGGLSQEPRVLGKPHEMALLAPYLPADGCRSPVEASGFAAGGSRASQKVAGCCKALCLSEMWEACLWMCNPPIWTPWGLTPSSWKSSSGFRGRNLGCCACNVSAEPAQPQLLP